MKLKSIPLEMCFCLVSFLAIVRFWPKTMGYKSGVLTEIEGILCGLINS